MIEHTKSTHDSINFDLSFILRNVKKWLFCSLCFAIICGVAFFVFMDSRKSEIYTAEALVTIAGKNNYSSYLSDSNLNTALSRNVSMWNSTAMRKAIAEANPEVSASGHLEASIIEGTGMVSLEATSYTAKGAYYLLSGAIDNYREVYSNFDTGYRVVVLTTVSPDIISFSTTSTWSYGFLGFAGGLCLALGIVVLWSMITDLLHSEEQAHRVLDAPMLGTLPAVEQSNGLKRNLIWDRKKLPMEYLEDMDMLASRLEQTLHHEEKKILMITSAFPNDGKTTLASNLAIALAGRNRRVLLMEMDLRNPSLRKVFRPETAEADGTDELKALEEMDWFYSVQKKQQLTRYIIPYEANEHLDVIYQFQPVRDADSFIENSRIGKKIRELSSEYDYVIFDTPPLGIVRDTEVIAQIAECSLLVTRQDICYARVMNDCIDRLENAGASCIGVVLNQCRGITFPGRKKDGKNRINKKNSKPSKLNASRRSRRGAGEKHE